jgi:hypothetical protein
MVNTFNWFMKKSLDLSMAYGITLSYQQHVQRTGRHQRTGNSIPSIGAVVAE